VNDFRKGKRRLIRTRCQKTKKTGDDRKRGKTDAAARKPHEKKQKEVGRLDRGANELKSHSHTKNGKRGEPEKTETVYAMIVE